MVMIALAAAAEEEVTGLAVVGAILDAISRAVAAVGAEITMVM
jgi:hypothetical protein